jgi:murein DD-endopeptidase MepM/ murein hydrolase activator NlpD
LQLILVPGGLRRTRTIHVRGRHFLAAFVFLAALMLVLAAIVSRLSVQWRLPVVRDLLQAMQHQEVREAQALQEGNLQALAARLGTLQAEMVRLDSLSQRLARQAGMEGEGVADGSQGGPFIPAPRDDASLQQEIERFSGQIIERQRLLRIIEANLRRDRMRQVFLPNTMPVAGGAYLGSPFGFRNDPFGRGRAIHEGLDFVAPAGTPILAAAGGIVVHSGFHPQFGNLVEINHGGEIITRYAHMSALSVRVGTSVRAGQVVGLLGSTGRSTGPHLHFEVRENGIPMNPAPLLAEAAVLPAPPGTVATRNAANAPQSTQATPAAQGDS